MGNSSWYMQNFNNSNHANSIFRIGKHDAGSKLDIDSNSFLNSKGVNFNAGRYTHISLIVQSNYDSHIQLTTKDDASKNVYLINRDGNFKVHHYGIGNRLEVNRNGNITISGSLATPNIPLFYTRFYKVNRLNWIVTDVPTHYKVISASKLHHNGRWENDNIMVRIKDGKWAVIGHNEKFGQENSKFTAVITWALPSVVNTNFDGN